MHVMSRARRRINRCGPNSAGHGCPGVCTAKRLRCIHIPKEIFPIASGNLCSLVGLATYRGDPCLPCPQRSPIRRAPSNLDRDWGNLNGAPGWKRFSSKFLLRHWRLAK